ncbi:MAG: SprT-like domain-containing protein [Nitrospinae bacterium]|nr:SprT-like domain-containing protein [Nitrospinota bacterium]
MDIDNQLKSAWVRQLREDWKNANYTYFQDKMRLPNIGLMSSNSQLGFWKGGHHRSLFISDFLVRNHSWELVLEVLYHEMAHQFVEEAIGIRDALPHGEAFRRICREHGIDPTASGEPRPWVERRINGRAVEPENRRALDKIQKLLALAQSANRHEAESAMEKAHDLLLKHNISLLEAGAKGDYIHKQIGEVGRKNPVKSLIGTIIGKFFFVETIWVFGYNQHTNSTGRVLEIYGKPENVEMAEYVHDYLNNVSESLWREYRKKKGLAGDKHRRTFIYGLLTGFYEKLDSRAATGPLDKLVWKGDPDLMKFFRRRNPKLRRATYAWSRSCEDAYASGKASGKTLVVHKGVRAGKSGKINLLN